MPPTAPRPLLLLSASLIALFAAMPPATAQQAADAEVAAASNDLDAAAALAPIDDEPIFSDGELDYLVGWFALYPDAVVAQILIAATVPLDLVRAERWLGDNADLSIEDQLAALEGEPWDDSVKVLAGLPGIVPRMADNLDETEDLGDAMVVQDADVLDAVQRIRAVAQTLGLLQTGEQMTVTVDEGAVYIDPTDPDQIFLPEYEADAIWDAYDDLQLTATNAEPAPAADAGTTVIVEQQPTTVVVEQQPSTVIVEQPATTETVVVQQNTGYSAGALAATGLFAFTTGIIVASLWDDDDYRWYGGCCYGRPNYHYHVHWHGGGVYRPGYRPPGWRPGRPGYGPRPTPYWRANARDRAERRRDLREDRFDDRRGRREDRFDDRRDRRDDRAGDRRDRRDDRTANRRDRDTERMRERMRDRGHAERPRDRQGRPGDRPKARPEGRPGARPENRAKARPDRRPSALKPGGRGEQVRKTRDRGAASLKGERRERPADRAARPKKTQDRKAKVNRPKRLSEGALKRDGGGKKRASFGGRKQKADRGGGLRKPKKGASRSKAHSKRGGGSKKRHSGKRRG